MSMMDDRPQRLDGNFPDGDGTAPAFQLTAEEQKILTDCSRKGVIYRAFPFGAITAATTYYALSTGRLKSSPRYGYIPKMALAAFSGYMFGKISFQIKCAEKLMELPDSKIGIAMRKRKGLPLLAPSEDGASPWPAAQPPNPNDYYVGENTPQTFEHDLNQGDSPAETGGDLGGPAPSYDDRRRQNRVDYFTDQNKRLSRIAERPSQPRQEGPPPPTNPREKRNQYGDLIEG